MAVYDTQEAHQDQIDDDKQFEAEQEALSDAVFETEEEFYEIISSIISCEFEKLYDINFELIEENVKKGKNVKRYIEEAEWEKAFDIMIKTLMWQIKSTYG